MRYPDRSWARARPWIIAFGVAMGAHISDLKAQPGDRLFTAGAAERGLCGTAADGKPRILIGRFFLFGDFDATVSRTLEQAFIASLVWSFVPQKDLSAFAWARDLAESRQFRDLPDLIDNAFVGGRSSGAGQEPFVERLREGLKDALKAGNCDYLLGGRISKEGDLINVTAYLLDVEKGRVSQPLAESVGDIQSLPRIAESFSTALRSQLGKGSGQKPPKWLVEVGCFSFPGSWLGFFRPVTDSFAIGIRRDLAQEFSIEKRFQVKPLAEKCSDASSEAGGDLVFMISAEVRATDKIEVTPYVTIKGARDSGQRPIPAIPLRPMSQPIAASPKINVLAELVAQVRSFLVAVTREDGSWPSGLEADWSPNVDPSVALASALQESASERTVVAAFRALAKNPKSGIAHFVLGKALQRKKEDELALENFSRAKDAENELPAGARANLSESIGETQINLKNPQEAAKSLSEAKERYRSAGQEPNLREFTRKLATALYLAGRRTDAIQELLGQRNLDSDGDSLRLLGWLYASSEQYDEAVTSLSRALLANPEDQEAKNLVADVYDAMGTNEFVARHFLAARRYFGLALAARQNGRLLYLAGVSAYEIDDLRDAVINLERLVFISPDKTSLKWSEAGWLNLLECYLLLGDYSLLEARARDASNALAWLRDSRLLAAYLGFLGKVLGDPGADITQLTRHAAYHEIEDAPSTASAKNLNWSNARIDEYLSKQNNLEPAKRRLIADVSRLVWRNTKSLQ